MLTGAALATTNRLPALLLPSDTFATRVADPVLQQLERPHDIGLTVNDAFRPLSVFFDRVQRPEQLFLDRARCDARPHRSRRDRCGDHRPARRRAGRSAGRAPRVPPGPGSGTSADHCRSADRWRGRSRRSVARSSRSSSRAVASSTPRRSRRCGRWSRPRASRSARRRRAAARLPWDHPQYLGGDRRDRHHRGEPHRGGGRRPSSASAPDTATSRRRPARPSRTPTRCSSTSTSRPSTPYKHGSQLPVVADARETLVALRDELDGYRVAPGLSARIADEKREWDAVVDRALAPTGRELPGQPEIIGAVRRGRG